ncbi:tetratricopeptide repeat-containing diguanylate cyclase [Hungatella hathewayi]|uniref:tetratricopeptide repeat-containing diguanylate cyclase n=1 Tax=Hungatella hathewayi TaxID=154046 RepID=UPI003563BE70
MKAVEPYRRDNDMGEGFRIKDYIEKIKEAHFKDQEEERRLCRELLAYSESRHNAYGVGFAYTYLLDYHISMHDTAGCSSVLKTALEFHNSHEFLDLRMQVYNFAGIYYSYIHDEITAFEYFLKSLELAEAQGDSFMKYRLYNNIAVSFHNKNDCEMALPYYQRAYDYLKFSHLKGLYTQYQLFLLQNLINCSIALNSRELVLDYCGKMKQLCENDPYLREDPSMPWQNAVIMAYFGKKEEAYEILNYHLDWEKDPLDATDIIELYPHILKLLLEWKEKDLAEKVLESLCYYLERESPRARQEGCDYRIQFYETFGLTDRLSEAYEQYYQASKEALGSVSHNQIRAMKEKLDSFEIQQKLNRLQKLSYMDSLCDLYNRRYYTEQMELAMKETGLEQLGIIILDIDYFKEYNDYYGHNNGDMVLKKVAICLKEESDDRMIPCRYGGDEFCCICENMAIEEIRNYLKNIRSRLNKLAIEHLKSRTAGIVTLSAGFSARPRQGLDQQTLFHEADEALYWAKTRGKNRDCCYQTDGEKQG